MSQMGLFSPLPTPYDPLDWVKRPLPERGRMVCEVWALSGYGSPLGVYAFYLVKLALYVAAWVLFCSFSPSLGGFSSIGQWWLEPLAFQKAIVWSMLFEALGLGCGSGPLTGRYWPPIGGFLYFLRPGTTKLPLFPGAPVIGRDTRSWLDVGLYFALIAFALRALLSPTITLAELAPIAVVLATLGVLDKTILLAARSEHYLTTIVCFLFAGNWIAGAKAVQLALWFFAGFSKLNQHFPAVVCVMTSNSPVVRSEWLRKRMYRHFPDDLRPSRLAVIMAHAGTVLEMSVPVVLLFSHGGPSLIVGMVLMLMLHGFITSNVPMGVPIEWNAMVVYGAFALFYAHPDVSIFDLRSPVLAVFLAIVLIGVPLFGNLFPERISFLPAMRYYAGNWACSVWLFRGESYKKLDRLKSSSRFIYEQLGRFYDRSTLIGAVGKVMAFRLMHLHGRAFPELIPRATEQRFEDYEYVEGEMIAGLALGWNFGDGHLHGEQLMRAIQAQCGFEPGELRCVFVESQPLGRSSMHYAIADANTGVLTRGELDVRELAARQPWAVP